MAGLEWVRVLDWDYWRESSRSLQTSHPTVARDYEPVPWDGHNTERGECHEIKVAYEGLFKRFTAEIRRRGYSIRTEQAYTGWIRRFIIFHNKRHPQDMGKAEIEAFLSYLAINRHVAASTQNQAFNALLFLCRNVLEIEFPNSIKMPIGNLSGNTCFLLKQFHLIHEAE